MRLLRHDVKELLRQIPHSTKVSSLCCRGGQLRELADLAVDRAVHVLIPPHVWHIHARHARPLRRDHLAEGGQHRVIPLPELVVRNHHEEDLLQRVLALGDEVQQQLVIRLLRQDRGCEGPLVGQVLLEETADAAGRLLPARKALEHLLDNHWALAPNIEAIQKRRQVFLWILLCLHAIGAAPAELALERLDPLHLRRVLQLQRGKKLASRDDAAGTLVVSDLAVLKRLQRHDHLHRLQLDVVLTLLHLCALVVQVAHHLTIHVGAELGRVADSRQHRRGGADGQPEAESLLLTLDQLIAVSHADVQRAIRLLADLGLDLRVADAEDVGLSSASQHLELKLLPVEDHFHREPDEGISVTLAHQDELTFLHGSQSLLCPLLHQVTGFKDCAKEDHIQHADTGCDHLICQEPVQPLRVDGVILELVSLEQVNQVVYWVPDVTNDVDVFQREEQRLPRLFAVGALGEDVPELRVCKLVNATFQPDAEVAPAVSRRLKPHAVDLAARWLEAFVRILRSDA
mmetsp:Transcript_76355/g.123458  ORF Transcript_76355/g.123458 Transcript_76355/m.123458 type:complete len:516 (-) Transcript_76355:1357-2904(-)